MTERRSPGTQSRATTSTTTVDAANDSRSSRQAAHDAHRASHVDTCDWCRGDQPRQAEHVSVQLRRRRLAAQRSPRLQDGRRDPISAVMW
jgi:hypothetical protein